MDLHQSLSLKPESRTCKGSERRNQSPGHRCSADSVGISLEEKNICFSNSVLGRVRADPTPQTIIIHSCKAMPSTADNTGLTDNLMQGERPHDTQVPETYFLNVGETLVVFMESFWIKSQSQEFYNDFNLFGETHSLKGRIVDF